MAAVHHRRSLLPLVAASALALLVQVPDAVANGRFPRTVKLITRPGHPQEMALCVTFGLLRTTDDGAHWTYNCESAVGFEGTFDPDYEYTAGGVILATTFRGMRQTSDGCTWTGMPAPLGALYVSVVAIGPDNAIYAASSDPNDNRVFKSTDEAASFVPLPPPGVVGDLWSSIEVAPGDAQRIYLAGTRTNGDGPRRRILFRSTNGGQSWTELSTAALIGTDISELQVAAISPTDADRVLMRVTLTGTALQETIYLSEDAGAAAPTWTKVLQENDNIPGVVARHDGTVWAATPFRGLKKSTDGGRTFTNVPDVTYEGRCLYEREDGVLFLCANDLPPDERALASSTTGAAGTWTPRLRFPDIAGPVACPVGTVQHDDCQDIVWCGIKEQLGITSTVVDCPAQGVDAGIDAGTAEPPGKTCCDVNAAPPLLETALIALGLAPGWLRRRRSRRRASTPA